MKNFFENFLLKTTTKLGIDLSMLALAYIICLGLKYDVNWSNNFYTYNFLIYLTVSLIVLIIRKTIIKFWYL